MTQIGLEAGHRRRKRHGAARAFGHQQNGLLFEGFIMHRVLRTPVGRFRFLVHWTRFLYRLVFVSANSWQAQRTCQPVPSITSNARSLGIGFVEFREQRSRHSSHPRSSLHSICVPSAISTSFRFAARHCARLQVSFIPHSSITPLLQLSSALSRRRVRNPAPDLRNSPASGSPGGRLPPAASQFISTRTCS